MKKEEKEIILVTQEECSDVKQSLKKVIRYGLDSKSKETLEEEVGELICALGFLMQMKILDEGRVLNCANKRKEFLDKWLYR